MQSYTDRSKPYTIAFVGNYLPRKCGIATFTTDLLESISRGLQGSDCWAVAMNDIPQGYDYPSQVRFEVNQNRLAEYQIAGEFLNINRVDVVSLQHEFGIFGGKEGSHVLALLRNLRMPVVATLHTVLQDPDPEKRVLLEEIGRVADRMVVMSRLAMEMLRDIYHLPTERVILIPHGIPDVPFIDPNYYKDHFGVEGRKVLLTFGLLSPGKGIECVIDALPQIVARYPETVYIILGATHPNVKKESGEEYRLSLQRRARRLKVEDHLIFHNRFVSLEELCEFLGCADVYVTPYLNKNQIVSGTLAYAMGAGKAIISTPYFYAEEMLADGRGRLVPFADSSAIAHEVLHLFDNEIEMNAMRKRAYKFSRKMIWSEVVQQYVNIFSQLKQERMQKPQLVFQTKGLLSVPHDLPEVKLDHLRLLTDDTGLLQHARFIVPDRNHGYSTDDNARGLIALLMAQDIVSDNGLLNLLMSRYLSFLDYAFNEKTGRFRNFMSYDRTWLEDTGSEDSHGRTLWGLGVAVASSKQESLVGMALDLFERALPTIGNFSSPRALAFGLMGISAYLQRFGGDSNTRRIGKILAEQLFHMYESYATDEWPWIGDKLTYVNGKIPHALIVAGRDFERGEMVEAGLRSLEWLVQIQKDPSGHFAPIGNNGWYPRNGKKARFDQQPIEAEAMIEACITAYSVSQDEKWITEATRCFDWFLGRNDLGTPIYDYTTGGCRDGLQPDGVNQNQGAESTLSWLLSLLTMYTVRNSRAFSIIVKPTQFSR